MGPGVIQASAVYLENSARVEHLCGVLQVSDPTKPLYRAFDLDFAARTLPMMQSVRRNPVESTGQAWPIVCRRFFSPIS